MPGRTCVSDALLRRARCTHRKSKATCAATLQLGIKARTDAHKLATYVTITRYEGVCLPRKVTQIQPGSAAQGALELGDIHRAHQRSVEVQRRERTLELNLAVSDLYTIDPDAYLEVGGAVITRYDGRVQPAAAAVSLARQR